MKLLINGLTIFKRNHFKKIITPLSAYKASTVCAFICLPIVFAISEIAIAKALTENETHPPYARKIISIRPEKDDNGLKVHIIADGEIKDYDSFRLSKPPRLVIDLPDVQFSVWYKTLLFENHLINSIRFGTPYSNTVRVVFDLVSEKDFHYKVFSKGNHLIVDFGADSEIPIVKPAKQIKPISTTGAPAKSKKAATEKSKIVSVSPARTITSIKLRTTDQNIKLHIFADGRLSRYNAFHLINPARFVIDLQDVQSSVKQKTWLVNSPLVKKIRLGTSYKDKVRFVFDLSRVSKLPHKVFTEDNQLIVVFETGTDFRTRKQIHETRKAQELTARESVDKAQEAFPPPKQGEGEDDSEHKDLGTLSYKKGDYSSSSESILPADLKIEDRFRPGMGNPVGRVILVQGKVVILHAGIFGGYWAKKGLPLYKGDTIITQSKGRVSFKLNDESLMTLASRTKLVINKSVYDHAKKSRLSFLKMGLGKARFFVTKFVNFRHSRFNVKTPTAVIGVRGSDFIVRATPNSTEVTALDKTELQVVSTAFPEEKPVLITDFERTTIEKGAPPSDMVAVTPEEIGQLKKELTITPKMVEPEAKIEGRENKAEKKKEASEESGDGSEGKGKGGGEEEGEDEGKDGKEAGKSEEGEGKDQEDKSERGEDDQGQGEDKGDEASEGGGVKKNETEESGGISVEVDGGVVEGEMSGDVVVETVIFVPDDELVRPEDMAEIEEFEEPIFQEIVQIEEVSTQEEAVVEQQQEASEEQHEETLEEAEKEIKEMPQFPGSPQ